MLKSDHIHMKLLHGGAQTHRKTLDDTSHKLFRSQVEYFFMLLFGPAFLVLMFKTVIKVPLLQ